MVLYDNDPYLDTSDDWSVIVSQLFLDVDDSGSLKHKWSVEFLCSYHRKGSSASG